MRSARDIKALDTDFCLNGLPLEELEYLRANAPCIKVELDEPSHLDWVWLVTRHADVLRVLKDSETFTSTSGTTLQRVQAAKQSMLTLDGDDHRRLRGVLRGAFTPRAVRAFAESYRELVRTLVAEAVDHGPVDFVEAVSIHLPLTSICDLLGIPDEGRDDVVRWGDALSSPLDPDLAPSPEYRFEAAVKLGEYCGRLADQRRDDPRSDIISGLAPLIGTEELSHDEFLGLMVLLAVAGNETTRNTISHSVEALATHSEAWDALSDADDSTWACAVEELIRWGSPVVQFRRTATVDVDLCGQQVRRGDPVVFSLLAANYDPRAFDAPDRLDIGRDPNPHVSFGGGSHFCLGVHLARIQAKLMLEELRRQVDSVELTGPVEFARSTNLRAVKHLPVTLHKKA